MIDTKTIKQDFPILQRIINGKKLTYLDSTATTQKPNSVIDAISDYYRNYNANVHRAIYNIGEVATEKYEDSRAKVADFIKARRPEEIIFVRNATEALNLLAYVYGFNYLKEGDEVITTVMEHHSNIVPWQIWSKKGLKLKFVDINDDGTLKMEDYETLITERTRIITVAHASNVLGTINDIKKIGKIAHDHNALFIVDAAQSVPHMPVNVQDLNCDFMAFSGHKMLGPMGIGVLYGKYEILENLEPFMGGGEMISEVHKEGAKWADTPQKFEAGTPNVAGAIGLSAAIDYLNNIGMQNVRDHEKELVTYALKKLKERKDLEIYGPSDPEKKGGVIAFNFKNINPESLATHMQRQGIMIHSHDVAAILDRSGVAVRSGHHCAQPLMDRLGVVATARASFYVYNDKDDVETFIDGLDNVYKTLKIK
ncbi:MAG: aminotransferase class V-fold PLP-dependent enzyme [Thermoplasmata archaeon]